MSAVDEPLEKARAMDKKRKNKYSTEYLLTLYRTPMTIDEIAAITGLNRASIHERLQKTGGQRQINVLTDAEKLIIDEVYKEGFIRGDGKLNALAKSLKRTKNFICRYAKEVGLTNMNRTFTQDIKTEASARLKAHHKEFGHPKGMLGKVHSPETKAQFSEIVGTRWANMTPEQRENQIDKMLDGAMTAGAINSRNTEADSKKSWKSGWRIIGNTPHYYRSRWEANYARILQLMLEQGQILAWEHEPDRFKFHAIKQGCRSCLPDFKVQLLDSTYEYHEVKGWMDERSKIMIAQMAQYYPEITLKIIDAAWFKANRQYTALPGWE